MRGSTSARARAERGVAFTVGPSYLDATSDASDPISESEAWGSLRRAAQSSRWQVAGLVPAGYGIGNFPFANLGQNIAVLGLALWVTECLSQLCSLTSNPVLGMLNYLQVTSCHVTVI